MTERAIEELLRAWQKRMGLERWEIELDLEKPSRPNGEGERDYCEASVWRSARYETATIYLHPDWRSWAPEEAERHLVHELVHLWTRDLEQAFTFVRGQLGPAAYDVFAEAVDHTLEGMVDLAARRLIAIAAGQG